MAFEFELRNTGGGKKNGESVTISALTRTWERIHPAGKDFPALAVLHGHTLEIRYDRRGNTVRLEGRADNGDWKRKVTFPCGKYGLWDLPEGWYEAEYDELNNRFLIELIGEEEQLSLF